MGLTAAKIRIILRWVHIVLGLEILCYIYSPFSKYLAFRLITQIFVVPILVISGLWLWKFRAFTRFFRIRVDADQ